MKQSTRRLIAAVLLAISLVLGGSLQAQQHDQSFRMAIVDPGSGGGTGGN